VEVEQGDDHAGQRQVSRHGQINAFGQQHHHLTEREDHQNGGVIENLHQIGGSDKRRHAAADGCDHQHDHRGQQRFTVFKQVLPHYAAS